MVYDVLVIGAGPAGSVASALLCNKGYSVRVVEKQHFPRFTIGESLLPECMQSLEAAGLLPAVQAMGYQQKNGAAFSRGDRYTDFDFREKFSEGWGTTFQVPRDSFDQTLANEASRLGAQIDFGVSVIGVDNSTLPCQVQIEHADGKSDVIEARFVLDASGFGRVLPRLFDLEQSSDFPVRASMFAHIDDGILEDDFDRNKILICVHPQIKEVWYWLIPFSQGRASVGVVLPLELAGVADQDLDEQLRIWINAEPRLCGLLNNAQFSSPVRRLQGYACNVKQLWGQGYALLGNAGEFLDPVFSSGVTIAMKSAELAVDVLDRQLRGELVDWDEEFARPLKLGVDTFRTFVEAWYDGRFQDVIFSERQDVNVTRMISSILAGYAWDIKNPYVKESGRRLNTLAQICQGA